MGSTAGGISIAESCEGPGNVGVGSGDDVGDGAGVLVGAGVEVGVGVGVGVNVKVGGGLVGELAMLGVATWKLQDERTRPAIAMMRKHSTRFIFSLFTESQPFLKHSLPEAYAPIAQNGYRNRLRSCLPGRMEAAVDATNGWFPAAVPIKILDNAQKGRSTWNGSRIPKHGLLCLLLQH